ncbi:MAG: helix-turn-helix transcriptional regulator [Ferruginibacter sp.]
MKQALQDRLLEARKKKGISQQDLGKAAKVHFSNVGKYERGEAVPASDILNRIAKALEVSTDYLLNGTLNDKSADAITDEELLLQFRKVEQLPTNKKKLIKEFLDAFIFKNDLQKQLTQ